MKNNKKGFTLVELVIVVAVMAILVAVAIPTVSTITGEAKSTVQASNCQTIESLMKLAEAEVEVKGGTAGYDAKLEDAKLGITGEKYYYNITTGKVTTSAPATKANQYVEIEFLSTATEADGAVKVSEVKTVAG